MNEDVLEIRRLINDMCFCEKQGQSIVGQEAYFKTVCREYLSQDEVVTDQEIWREYFNVGELEVVDYDLEKKYAIFEIRNFDLHKTFCTCVEGYLKNIMKLLLNPRKIFSQEVKCTFKGQSSHRFRVTWK